MAAISSLVSTPSKPQVKPPMRVEMPPQNNLKHLLGQLTKSRSSLRSDNVACFAAHDLRHHLCAIYANAELMCDAKYPPSDRQEMLEDIRSAVTCMTEILDSFLLHSKNGYILDFRLEPLSLLIEKATQMVRSHPDAYDVEFILNDLPFVEVHADATWLSSAIFNLLLNACQAVQFAPESKKVRVECNQDQMQICIRITDSGPGVPQAIQEHLFQPFVRARRSKRTGLGLAIVKSVVREHGGEVYLDESNPGNTSFVVRLPTIYAVTMDAFPHRVAQR